MGVDWSQTRQGQEDQFGSLHSNPGKQNINAGRWDQNGGPRGKGEHRTQRTRVPRKTEDGLWRVAGKVSRRTERTGLRVPPRKLGSQGRWG